MPSRPIKASEATQETVNGALNQVQSTRKEELGNFKQSGTLILLIKLWIDNERG